MFLVNTKNIFVFLHAINKMMRIIKMFLQYIKVMSVLKDTAWQTVEVPANSMRPVSISASMQPVAHMSMALV